jgi:beta-xylosidase
MVVTAVNMKKRLFQGLAILGLLVFMAGSSSGSEYPKLILPGDYPDPTVLRDGDDYYMTHSPFLYTPGFLIWHSRDLVHWGPICRAMTDVVGSAMAPDLVKHDDRFYIYFPAQKKNWVIWADDIRGPWSKPVRLEVPRIDPGHAVGEDGKRYLFLSAGHRILLSDDGLSVAGELEKVYEGWEFPKEWITEGMWLESPKILRRGDYFYMVSAEGGTAGPPTSHMVVVARSKSIHGPWVNSPYNPVVHTYSADEQWWSKGHGTVIDDVNGNWWIVYHAYENGHYPLGRQTLLEPIVWTDDGWLRAAETAAPVRPSGAPMKGGMGLSDDFDGKQLGLQWITWRNYGGIRIEDGCLHLEAKGKGPKDARLLLTTATDHAYEIQVEVSVTQGTTGGLVLFYSEKAFAGIVSDGRQITVYENDDKPVQHPDSFGEHFFVKIVNWSNICDLLASGDGKTWKTLRQGLDISQMHHNNHGGFFALRPGLVATGDGAVLFDNFEYITNE